MIQSFLNLGNICQFLFRDTGYFSKYLKHLGYQGPPLPGTPFMLIMVKMSLKGEVGGGALNSHGNYIVDHGKSWNCIFEFLCVMFASNKGCGEPGQRLAKIFVAQQLLH